MYRQSVLNLLLKLNGYSLKTGFSIGFGQKTITDAFLKIQLQLTKFSGLKKIKNHQNERVQIADLRIMNHKWDGILVFRKKNSFGIQNQKFYQRQLVINEEN